MDDVTITAEFYQTGALITPGQAAVVIALAVALFLVLGWRFLHRWNAR